MKFIDPRSDIAFKKIFGSSNHPEVLLSFLNAVLDLKSPIVDITFVNPYQTPRLEGFKETTLDVRATDAAGHDFIVEMQMEGGDAFGKRAQYYAFKSYVNQLQSAEKYRKLKTVYFIGVLNFKMFDGAPFQSRHITINQNTGNNDLRGVEFNFIELPKFTKALTQLEGIIDKWVYFLKNAQSLHDIPKELANTSEIVSAFEIADQHGWDAEELEVFEYWLMKEEEQIDILESRERKGREEGREEGREKGREEGREEGEQTGLKKGREEGQAKEKEEIAINLLQNTAMSDIDIATITGLKSSCITKLRNREG